MVFNWISFLEPAPTATHEPASSGSSTAVFALAAVMIADDFLPYSSCLLP